MKKRRLFTLAMAGLMATCLTTTVWAKDMPSDPKGGKPPVEHPKPSTLNH